MFCGQGRGRMGRRGVRCGRSSPPTRPARCASQLSDRCRLCCWCCSCCGLPCCCCCCCCCSCRCCCTSPAKQPPEACRLWMTLALRLALSRAQPCRAITQALAAVCVGQVREPPPCSFTPETFLRTCESAPTGRRQPCCLYLFLSWGQRLSPFRLCWRGWAVFCPPGSLLLRIACPAESGSSAPSAACLPP